MARADELGVRALPSAPNQRRLATPPSHDRGDLPSGFARQVAAIMKSLSWLGRPARDGPALTATRPAAGPPGAGRARLATSGRGFRVERHRFE
jgi:hypothetical protein